MKAFYLSDTQLRLPFNGILSGPSGSGKTTILLKILQNAKTMIHPSPKEILYCYGQFSDTVTKVENMGIKVYQGVPSEEELSVYDIPLFLILDDCQQIITEERLSSLFTKETHHNSIGCLITVQNLFDKKLKAARSNAHYYILTRSPSAQLSVRNLGCQLFPSNLSFFMDSYKKATKENFGYLMIDLHPSSPTDLRLRTNIFPPEEVTVYLPQVQKP